MMHYDMTDAEQKIIEVRRRLDDGRYHYVTFIRNENNVTVQVDDLSAKFRSHGVSWLVSSALRQGPYDLI